MTSAILLAHPALLAAKKPASGGSSVFLILLIVVAVAGYFLWLRPQQQKQRKARAAQQDIQEGDEVVTVGGIVGRVLKMEDDRVHLLTGYHATPDLGDHLPHRMTFVRQAISRKVEAPVPAADDEAGDDFEFEHDGAPGNGHVAPAFGDGFAGPGAGNGHVENGEVVGDAATPQADDAGRRKGRGRGGPGGSREGTAP